MNLGGEVRPELELIYSNPGTNLGDNVVYPGPGIGWSVVGDSIVAVRDYAQGYSTSYLRLVTGLFTPCCVVSFEFANMRQTADPQNSSIGNSQLGIAFSSASSYNYGNYAPMILGSIQNTAGAPVGQFFRIEVEVMAGPMRYFREGEVDADRAGAGGVFRQGAVDSLVLIASANPVGPIGKIRNIEVRAMDITGWPA